MRIITVCGAVASMVATIWFLAPNAVGQTISFDPGVSLPEFRDFTVEIALTGPQTVMGVDMVFTYDPYIVDLVTVEAGDWFTASGLDYQFWVDPLVPAGTVHLSTALLGAGAADGGGFAVLHFHAVSVGVVPLRFLSLTVRDDMNANLLAEHSTGDRIVIEPAVPVEAKSFGDLKVLYR